MSSTRAPLSALTNATVQADALAKAADALSAKRPTEAVVVVKRPQPLASSRAPLAVFTAVCQDPCGQPARDPAVNWRDPAQEAQAALTTIAAAHAALPPSMKAPLETVTVPNVDPAQHLELLTLIGEGGFGSVFRGRDSTHGEVAVKVVIVGAHDGIEPSSEAIAHEVSAHEALEAHAFACASGEGLFVPLLYSITQPSRTLLAMELVRGVALDEHLEHWPHGRLPEATARPLVFRLLEAVAFFHAAGVAHLDITPANVLVSAAGAPRLVDYGSCAFFGASGEVMERGGAENYKSPERLEAYGADEPFDGAAADTFSVGCLLFRLVAGALLCDWESALSCDDPLARIAAGELPIDGCEPPLELSDAATALVRSLTALEPTERPTAAAAQRHGWFHGGASDNDDPPEEAYGLSESDESEEEASADVGARVATWRLSFGFGAPQRGRSGYATLMPGDDILVDAVASKLTETRLA